MVIPMTLQALDVCDSARFTEVMGEVFEHAPWVAQAVVGQRPFNSAQALHEAMLAQVRALPEPDLVRLLAGHPELGGADARQGKMTADSVREQGALALNDLATDAAQRWDALNAAYRTKFGFPFILCVSRHTRASVLSVFEKRLLNDRATELTQALTEIGLITRLRLAARILDHGLSRLTGALSTHVLDTSRGCAAAGVRLTLHELGDDQTQDRLLVEGVTDVRGRTAKPLLSGAPLRIGAYQLRFHVGDYFRSSGAVQGEWPFLEVVPVSFNVAEPEGDYHVPLTVTPWSYSTYRGQ
ncbi:MAG: 2-oxo-4-hydroxy-4-carboxy-5-ureidoimidazoline decarboxylase [Alcaligenaceae bacterium]